MGRYAEAEQRFRQALPILDEVADEGEAGETLTRLGQALHATGDPGRARDCWGRGRGDLRAARRPAGGRDPPPARLTLARPAARAPAPVDQQQPQLAHGLQAAPTARPSSIRLSTSRWKPSVDWT